MLATWPPGRTISVHIVKVWGMPTASMATSTPWPSVSAMTWSFQSASPELTTLVAPNSAARLRRAVSRSIAMTLDGP